MGGHSEAFIDSGFRAVPGTLLDRPTLSSASRSDRGGTRELGAIVSGASAVQMIVWGFVLSTMALYHATFAVNSVAHSGM